MKIKLALKNSAAALFAVFFLIACDSPIPLPDDANIQSPVSQESAMRAWPPPDQKGGSVELSNDPLAVNYYVVLDGSGSMAWHGCSGDVSKEKAAKKALSEFARAVPEDANLGLFVFYGSDIGELVPLGTGNAETFIQKVNAVGASGGTPLSNAVNLGYDALMKQARTQNGYGEYHLVVVTDGEANVGQDPTEIVNYILARSPVVIQTIGFCIGENHSLNQPGRTIYRTADSPEELRKGLQSVLAEAPEFNVLDFSH